MKEELFNDELVSVIIPMYNATKYIEETLNSVLNQAYYPIEIIIIDDCSTDDPFKIIKEYQEKYPYIKYSRLEKNSGVAVARNIGIKMAKGRYIAFIDSDDIWIKGKLQAQLELFKKHEGTPFTYTAILYIDEDGNLVKGKRKICESVTYRYLLKNTVIATSTVIIDRNIVPEIVMPNRRSAEDYSLWLQLLHKYGCAYGINVAYTKYRKTATSISANRIGEIKHFWAVQIEDLKITPVKVGINLICYIFNAVKKHYI